MVSRAAFAARGLLAAALLGALLGGCRPRDGRADVHERVAMQNDFEVPAGGPLPDGRTTAQAHSGRLAITVDSAHEYSETYRAPLGKLFGAKPRKLRFSTWAWVPGYNDNAVIIIQISAPGDPGQQVFYQALCLADEGPYQKWKLVSQDYDLPDNIGAGSELVIYGWRLGATHPVYFDDWKVAEIR